MNRKREQAELLFQLGQLLGPMLNVANNPEGYDREERTRIIARYCAEWGRLSHAITTFARGEPGHMYHAQYAAAINPLGSIEHIASDHAALIAQLPELRDRVFQAIMDIPVPVESAIHAAHTPFSTYCFVKDLCSTAKTQLVWMDRYCDQTIFHRYFVDTPTSVQITLVTWPDTKRTSKKNQQRYSEFLDISRLFAQERGPQGYQLVTSEAFHDRWLRCDDKLFSVGGSIKDLGKDVTFTISKLDSTPENIQHFDDAVRDGREVFGPNTSTHP